MASRKQRNSLIVLRNDKFTMKSDFKDIIQRIEKLEETVFKKKEKVIAINNKRDFAGTKGGILLLLSEAHFNKLRSAQDVKNELAKNDYFYSIQVVQTTLNRLTKEKGPLVSMKEGGKKFYVKRK